VNLNPLTEVVTTSEASQKWGLASSTLRCSIKFGRFKPDEIRKAGREWLILRSAIVRLYGEMKEEYVMLSKFSMEVIAHYMDDELREQVHAELAPCTDEEFLTRYIELHKAKFNEDFTIN
jgi:hypothetical protein